MYFEFAELLKRPRTIDRLELHSFEMNVYLVKLTIGGQQAFVYEEDSPKRFHSTQHVRDSFEDFDVTEAVMLHDSPYDEMIGNPPKTGTTALPFSMTQPY